MDKAGEMEIIVMINQATSPTFFLASARDIIKRLPYFDKNLKGIRADYFNKEMSLYEQNEKIILLTHLKHFITNDEYKTSLYSKKNCRFRVNIQYSFISKRLFEWGEDQIIQLLDDLYSSYKRDKESAYYIGMLTVKRTESSIELVDGQQRFTAMILLGIHFKWNDFLYVSTEHDNILRLQFSARRRQKIS